jgi:hypothetical protein
MIPGVMYRADAKQAIAPERPVVPRCRQLSRVEHASDWPHHQKTTVRTRPQNRPRGRRTQFFSGGFTRKAYYSYALDNSLTKRRVQNTGIDTYYYYDANGNLTVANDSSAGATYYAYGPHQLVTRIAPPPSVEAASYFFYDSRLNRYCENRAGTVTYFLWDGSNLLEERNSDGSLKVRYSNGMTQIPGIGSVIEAQRTAGGATYYQYLCMDHRGTVAAVTDVNQSTLLTYTQDAFGRQLAGIGGSTPAVPNELIYQTNWRTPLIGGQYYWFSPSRIGDPIIGRFLGRDQLPILTRLANQPGYTLGIYDKTMFTFEILRSASNNWYRATGLGRFNGKGIGLYSATYVGLYTYAMSSPAQIVDVLGLDWTKECVLDLLCCCAYTRPLVPKIDNLKVYKCTSLSSEVKKYELIRGDDGKVKERKLVETKTNTVLGLEADNTAWIAGSRSCVDAAIALIHEYAHSNQSGLEWQDLETAFKSPPPVVNKISNQYKEVNAFGEQTKAQILCGWTSRSWDSFVGKEGDPGITPVKGSTSGMGINAAAIYNWVFGSGQFYDTYYQRSQQKYEYDWGPWDKAGCVLQTPWVCPSKKADEK